MYTKTLDPTLQFEDNNLLLRMIWWYDRNNKIKRSSSKNYKSLDLSLNQLTGYNTVDTKVTRNIQLTHGYFAYFDDANYFYAPNVILVITLHLCFVVWSQLPCLVFGRLVIIQMKIKVGVQQICKPKNIYIVLNLSFRYRY